MQQDLEHELSPAKRALLEQLRRGEHARPEEPIEVSDLPWSPLSPEQERIWAVEDLFPQTSQHNLAAAYAIRGALDRDALTAALARIIQRHEPLRTAFRVRDGQRCQEPQPAAECPLEICDLQTVPAGERDAAAREAINRAANQHIDISSPPLSRATLVQTSATEHALVLVVHHIVADGWSLGVLIKELSAIYTGLVTGHAVELAPLRVRFRDCAQWLRREQSSLEAVAALEYHKQELSGDLPVLEMPVTKSRPPIFRTEAGTFRFILDESLRAAVERYAAANATTAFSVLFAAFQVLLLRFSGRSDVVTGAATAGRTRPEFDNLIGCFFNTVAVRTALRPEGSFNECVRQASAKVRGAMAHQAAPFQEVVRAVLKSRSPGRAPVFQSLFAFQNAPIPVFELPGASVSRVQVDMHATQLDLTLLIDREGQAYDAKLWYCKALFDEATVASFCDGYVRLLRDAVTRPITSLETLQLLSKEARDAEVVRSGGPLSSLAWQRIDDRVFEIARETPGAPAVSQAGSHLTYADLVKRASQIAHALEAQGVGRGSRVAVLLERTVELPAALLGVQLTGAAYVPLSESLPPQRLALMFADAKIDAFLIHESFRSSIGELTGERPVVLLEQISRTAEVRLAGAPDRTGSDPIYVIFTSGSTGAPKGVEVLQHSVANLLASMSTYPGFGAGDILISQAALTFDMSPLELFLPLTYGGCVEILPRRAVRDPQLFLQALKQSGATHLQATPSLLQMLLTAGWVPESQLRIWCGGEALPKGLAATLLKRVDELYNLYGPTECTVWATIGRVRDENAIDVGDPIDNTRIYILDTRGEIVPRGVLGEIAIAGGCVARGYITESAQREQRFTDDSLFGAGRMYRTGDLGRRRRDGRLEVLGRNDQQVKIRGYRIELGEIETSLSTHPAVRTAAVLVRQHGTQDRRLIAYVAWKSLLAPDEEAQRLDDVTRFLSERLPAYMLPSAYVTLDELPLTESGKIDRIALAKQTAAPALHRSYLAPRTDLERTLCELWKTTLRVDRVGVRDDFFELGGHSILATQLLAATQEATGCRIAMERLYLEPTIEGMVGEIERRGPEVEGGIASMRKLVANERDAGEPFVLTEVQQAYLVGRSSAFSLGNISTHIYTEIDVEDLDAGRLEAALNRLIARHGMLRAVFSNDARQRILADVPAYTIRNVPLSDSMAVREEMSHQVFATDQWPLFDLRVSNLDPRTSRLHVSIDLLIADAMSLQLLHRGLFDLYLRPETTLPAIDISFRDYVLARQQLESAPWFTQCEKYWTDRIDTLPAGPELPIIKDPSAIAQPRFVRRRHVLSRQARRSLDELCRGIGVTSPTFLLSVCTAVLGLWSKSNRFTINIPLLNRYGSFDAIHNLVGDFTSLLMLEVGLDPGDTFVSAARKVQKQLWADMEHREYDGVVLLREINRRHGGHGANRMPVVFTSAVNLVEDSTGSRDESARSGLPQPGYAISQTSQAWLDCQLWEHGGELLLAWDAIDELFAPRVLDDMFAAYVACVEAMSADGANLRLRDLIHIPDRQAAVHAAANATEKSLTEELLQDRFMKWVVQQPSAPAVICGSRVLPYEELHRRATVCARQLPAARENDLIAVCMDKGWEQIVAVLAILYSGAAYVPIDAGLPDMRIQELLQLCKAKAVVTQPHLRARMAMLGCETVVVEDGIAGAPEGLALREIATRAGDLAYVIFTSGSTGVPKGVMIDHRGACNTLIDINSRLDISGGDRVLALSSLSFDLSVYDVFGLLSVGGAIVLPDPARGMDPAHWVQLLIDERITVWNSVPALAGLLVSELDRRPPPFELPLRRVLLSGDWIPLSLAATLRSLLPEADLLSLGGATEASIWSICHPIETLAPEWKSIPYGRALSNQSIHILKDDLSPAPDWTVGEIYIGGAGVAQGYLNDPARTRAQFIVHPDTGRRLYRTGDLGRWMPDGAIEFLGREDGQVKVAGHRIELGEIEAALRRDSTVVDCIVLALGDTTNKRLVAYVVPVASTGDSTQWREGLRSRLPDYMVPQVYVKLERLPLTANGKIDRRSLPAPAAHGDDARLYVEPTNAIERALCDIWQEIVVVDRVGIHDNFFEIGGDSILAVEIAGRVERDLGIHLSFKQFIATPTVAGVAAYLQSQHLEVPGGLRILSDSGRQQSSARTRQARTDSTAPGTIAGIAAYLQTQRSDVDLSEGPAIVADTENRYAPFPLSEVQQSFVLGRTDAFEIGNVSIHRYSEFDLDKLDVQRLSVAFNRLIRRHDILRAVIQTDATQSILPAVPEYVIPITDLRGREAAEVAIELGKIRELMSDQVRPLTQWPTFDVRLSRLGESAWRLHASVDLVNLDGWSLNILAADLSRFYGSPDVELPPLPVAFRDYIMAREQMRRSSAYSQARDYWLERLDSLPTGPELPLAQAPDDIAKPQFRRKQLRLNRGAWSSFKATAAANGISPSAALVSAFTLVLRRWSTAASFTLNLTLSDRPRYPQAFEVVGDFTSVLLLEINLSPTSTFVDTSKAVQSQLWTDLEHALFSGVDVLREMNSRVGRAHAVRMPIVFTYVTDTGGRRNADTRSAGGELATQLRENEIFAITQTPQVWLDHQVIDRDGLLEVNWDYVDGLFAPGVLDAMFEAYQNLLGRLTAEASWSRTLSVPLPLVQERSRELVNATQFPTQPERLEALFLRQVGALPTAPAVVTSERTIRYDALERASRRVAHELKKHGVRPNELVAVFMEKGWEQVVAALGVLRAGAAYMPVEATLPQARVLQLLEEGAAKLVLIQATGNELLDWPTSLTRVVVSDALFDSDDVQLVPVDRPPTDLAYVIFTSGSTGKPKGVMIDHNGAVNTILDINHRFGVSHRDRVLALSSLSFDLSVYDIFGALAAGATLVVPRADGDRDPTHWHELIEREGVTIWNSAPALAQMYVDRSAEAPIAASVRLILLSGDWIPLALASRVRRLAPQAMLVSLGGATEASIWSIFHIVQTVDERWSSVPYGRPLANQTFHVLDALRADCPDWVAGDLFIGGVGLARGYWGDESTSQSRFIPHPRYGRVYDTGDVGRYLPNGDIEFLGRRDTQIKLRGHRIEMGEIEAALSERPDIVEAIVVLEGEGAQKQLAAHIKFKDPVTPSPAQAEPPYRRLADVAAQVDRSVVAEIPSVASLEQTVSTQNAFYRGSACKAFLDTGVFQDPNESCTAADIMAKGRIAPRYHRWVNRALAYLTGQGLLRSQGNSYSRAASLADFSDSSALQDLLAVLREDKHSAELYLHESTETNYQVYFDEAHRLASSLFAKLIAYRDPGTPLRVLEIGAGLGSLTRHLVPLLAGREDVSYTFTDISQYFLSKAADDYASTPWMEYELLDLNTDPAAQGFWPHSFDIVVASSVLHALENIDVSLKHIVSLLKSNGVMLLIEETHFFPFFDLSMGLQQGFDSFSDTGLRGAHPLLSRDQWQAATARCGFAEYERVYRSGSFAEFFGLDVLAARAPTMPQHADAAMIDRYLRSRLPEYMVPRSLYVLDRVPLSSNGKVNRAALASRKIRKRRSRQYVAPRTPVESTLCRLWAENLQLEKAGIRDNYFEIGGDSLLATRLIAQTGASFGLNVPIRTLFEHPTVEAFAVAMNGLSAADTMEIPRADRERYRI